MRATPGRQASGVGIARNSAVMMAAEVLLRAMQLPLFIWAAHLLGPGIFGEYMFGLAIMGIFAALSDWGLSVLLPRSLAVALGRKRARIAAGALAIKVTGTVAGLLAVALLVPFNSGEVRAFTALVLAGVLFRSYGEVLCGALRADGRFPTEAGLRISASAAQVILGATALASGAGLIGLGLAVATAGALQSLAAIAVNRRYGTLQFTGVRFTAVGRATRRMLRASLPFATMSILVILYFRVDTLMLQRMAGPESVGVYNSAYRLFEGFLLVPLAVGTVLLPAFSKLMANRDREALAALLRNVYRYMATLCFPIAVLMVGFAAPVVRLIYPAEYAAAGVVLAILSLAVIAVFFSCVGAMLINASPRPAVNAWLAGGMVVANVALNLVLIPRHGATGAAVATAATEGAGMLGAMLYLHHRIVRVSLAGVVRPGLAAAVLAGAVYLFPHPVFLPLHVAAFLAAAIALRVIVPAEVREFVAFRRTAALQPGTEGGVA